MPGLGSKSTFAGSGKTCSPRSCLSTRDLLEPRIHWRMMSGEGSETQNQCLGDRSPSIRQHHSGIAIHSDAACLGFIAWHQFGTWVLNYSQSSTDISNYINPLQAWRKLVAARTMIGIRTSCIIFKQVQPAFGSLHFCLEGGFRHFITDSRMEHFYVIHVRLLQHRAGTDKGRPVVRGRSEMEEASDMQRLTLPLPFCTQPRVVVWPYVDVHERYDVHGFRQEPKRISRKL